MQAPGDGRELVVTDPYAVKVRAEDGRRVDAVDITPFINNLPYGARISKFPWLMNHCEQMLHWMSRHVIRDIFCTELYKISS